MYEKAYNSSFRQKIESVQYNACLAITGAMRGTSKEKLYDELGVELLQLDYWFWKLSVSSQINCFKAFLMPKIYPFSNQNIFFSKIRLSLSCY